MLWGGWAFITQSGTTTKFFLPKVINARIVVMKIFVSHSNHFDFKNQLYLPLRNSQLNSSHQIFLPEESDKLNTKELIKNSALLVAEVSYPSTGQGIEIGWADNFDIPIVCIYKAGKSFSSSLKFVTDRFFSYTSTEDMIKKLSEALEIEAK